MNDTAVITLIVVSAALTIFLVLGCLVLYNIVCLLKQVRRVVQKAESVAESVESAANVLDRTASPLAALKIVGSIVENVARLKNKREKKDE